MAKLALLAVAVALCGCARLSTERARYVASETIRVRFDNRGPLPVRFYPCYPSVERRVGDRWREADWVAADETSNPLRDRTCAAIVYRLPPDEGVTWRVRLRPGSPSGTYRFSVTLRHGPREESLASPPFAYAPTVERPLQ